MNRFTLLFILTFATSLRGEPPKVVLKRNPQIQVATKCRQWKLRDLSKVAGGPLVGTNSYGINAADLDGDGDVDLVLTFQSGGKAIGGSSQRFGSVYWLENLTKKTRGVRAKEIPRFRARLIDDHQLTPKVAVIGPTIDGRPSVVVPCYLAGETIIYQSTKQMKWRKVRLKAEELKQPVRALVVDMNQDGRKDIVVTSIAKSGKPLACFQAPNNGDRWHHLPINMDASALVGLDAADVDGDGDTDLVVASPQHDDPWLLRNLDGKGTRWKQQAIRTHIRNAARKFVGRRGVSQSHVRLIDVDRDGDLDCIETSLDYGYAAWRENRGSAKSWRFRPIARMLTQSYSFDVGDINQDGLPDIVVPANGARGIYTFFNQPNQKTWRVHFFDTRKVGLTWPNIVRLRDINKDGKLDVLASDWGRRPVVWLNTNVRNRLQLE